ncbi:MAG: RNA methyltransferase substrate-binding domain-containing protein, partial [Candidatus Acidiferrales bacterium]
MSYLLGIHAVEEALQAGRPLDRIVIAIGRHGTRMEEIVRRARERGVPVRFEDRGQLDRLAMSRDHQGVIALAASRAALALEDLLQKKTGQSLLVLLDGVED